ncbi:MAG: helix-turn-helix domain-containing protein [Ruminococcus callidus]
MYHSYADIPNPWDRLRWCRYGLDLLQKEVAAMVGMEEWLYRDLESGAFHRSFTPELADKLAALYGIPVEDILDDYTLFLHRGGGDFLRRYREAKGWSRQQLADHAKVRQDKYSLLGDRTENHQPKVFPASGRKSWARFSFYAAHVRYGNFSPAKRKSSSARHDM